MEDNKNIVTSEENTEGTEDNKKTYTEDEVLALIQKESDKRVTQALKTAESRFEKKFTEAEKLRNMDEQSRLQYKNEQLEAKIAEMERDRAIAENSKQATNILAERGLPVQFVDYIIAEDADTMLDNIEKFDRAFKAAVADAVTSKIQHSGNPKGATAKTQTTLNTTKGLSLAERQELKNTNPALYESIRNK